MIEKNITNYHPSLQQDTKECFFSIIIPTLNEADQINAAIGHLYNQNVNENFEIIVADGDPQGGTIKAIANKSIKTTTAQKGRARQMNAGVEMASGEILVFLHADTLLPKKALKKIRQAMEDQRYVAGAFDLSIDSDRLFLRYIAARARFRSRLNRIPYGDQAIFIRKDYFDNIGRFKEIPLMEDVDLMVRIKKRGDKIIILRDRVKTSARRWETEGAVYTTIRNHILVSLYFLGVNPVKLAKYYWRNPSGRKS